MNKQPKYAYREGDHFPLTCTIRLSVRSLCMVIDLAPKCISVSKIKNGFFQKKKMKGEKKSENAKRKKEGKKRVKKEERELEGRKEKGGEGGAKRRGMGDISAATVNS